MVNWINIRWTGGAYARCSLHGKVFRCVIEFENSGHTLTLMKI